VSDSDSGRTRRAQRLRTIAAWCLSVPLAFVFLMAGGMKLTSRPNLVEEFRVIGAGQWFRYLTGTLEVIGALGLLIPRLARGAAVLLAAVMIGAVTANLTVLHVSPALPAALLVLALARASLRQ
jgi:putative oxidoreductase